jgi:hypothetical protein
MTTTTPERPELDSPRGHYGAARVSHVKNLLAHANVATRSGLSPEIIRKMRRHYQVASSLTVQSLPLIRADWSIECEDEAIRDTLTEAYRAISFKVHRSMTRALSAGYSPNELVWTYLENLRILFPGDVRDLEPSTCIPSTDETGQLDGFVQRVAGGDDEPFDKIYALWIVEGMESGNHYGRSILDAALDPWADHTAIRAFHLRYLERFGEPVVLCRAPAGKSIANGAAIETAVARREEVIAAGGDGNTIPIPEPVLEDNLDTALSMGENLRHHSVVALPSSLLFGADGKPTGFAWSLEFLESKGGAGNDFLEALREAAQQIARAMFVPDLLISNTADTGSNALGSSHRSVWSESVEGRLDDYSRQITEQILEPARILNYGPASSPARLVFAPLANEAIDRWWKLVETLAAGGTLPLDVVEIAKALGIPLLDPDAGTADAETGALAASPFASVGLPALIACGIITEQEGRDLLGIPGDAPGLPEATDAQLAAARALTVAERESVRVLLELPARPSVTLSVAPVARPALELARPSVRFAADDPIAGLPDWKVPQSYDPPPFRRELTDREKRVGFAQVEAGLNATEARVLEQLEEILGIEHDRVLRQLSAIVRKGSAAEVVAALGTVEVKGGPAVARAWADLMSEVGSAAAAGLRSELATYADQIKDVGPEGRALFKAYANAAAERVLSGIVTETRIELLNAYTSGVSRAGMASIVGQVFDGYTASEGKAVRLTTRMLSAKSLNYSRASVVEASGIPLAGAQYSAILDRRTCELCEKLDEQVIAIENTDLARFTPPIHHNCRCLWVWITRDEADFTPTWSTPSASSIERFGGLVF